jgi:hypothetical protein
VGLLVRGRLLINSAQITESAERLGYLVYPLADVVEVIVEIPYPVGQLVGSGEDLLRLAENLKSGFEVSTPLLEGFDLCFGVHVSP